MRLLYAAMFSIATAAGAAPCDGLDRSQNLQGNTAVATLIAKQLQRDKVEILGSIRSGGWSVIHVQPAESEPLYLFYSGDVGAGKAANEWSGAAAPDEAPQIRAWVLQNVRGIPPRLAECFAARVTEKNAL